MSKARGGQGKYGFNLADVSGTLIETGCTTIGETVWYTANVTLENLEFFWSKEKTLELLFRK